MAKPKLVDGISNWYMPIASLQTSPLEFYEAVTAAVNRRELHEVSSSRMAGVSAIMWVQVNVALRKPERYGRG
jgi:hypothetical protein